MTPARAAAHDLLGYRLIVRLLGTDELEQLRDAAESALRYATERVRLESPPCTRTGEGHLLQTVAGTSVHWEPDAAEPTVRNMLNVAHLDPRIEVLWRDPRLHDAAAQLIGVERVAPLESRMTFKRATVGSAFDWHQDYTHLYRFRGEQAAQAVTAMVLLDDTGADNAALQVVPGSHLGPARRDGDPLRPEDAAPVSVEAPAGSVLLFPSLMVHASPPNRSDRDRRTVLLGYQPAGRQRLDEYP